MATSLWAVPPLASDKARVKEAEKALAKAMEEYLKAKNEFEPGEYVTAWGVVGASTMVNDKGDDLYKTWALTQDGLPPYTFLGIMSAEHTRLKLYMAGEYELEDDDE